MALAATRNRRESGKLISGPSLPNPVGISSANKQTNWPISEAPESFSLQRFQATRDIRQLGEIIHFLQCRKELAIFWESEDNGRQLDDLLIVSILIPSFF